MKIHETVAKAIEKVAMTMAKKACGSASWFGTYQPKEPKSLEKLVK